MVPFFHFDPGGAEIATVEAPEVVEEAPGSGGQESVGMAGVSGVLELQFNRGSWVFHVFVVLVLVCL